MSKIGGVGLTCREERMGPATRKHLKQFKHRVERRRAKRNPESQSLYGRYRGWWE